MSSTGAEPAAVQRARRARPWSARRAILLGRQDSQGWWIEPLGRRRHSRRRGDAGQGIPRRRHAETHQRRRPADQVAAATGRQLDQRGRAGREPETCLPRCSPIWLCVSRATRPTLTIWQSRPAGSGTPADGPRLVLLPGPGWPASGLPGGQMSPFPLLKVFISLAGRSPTRTPTGKAVAGWPRCR